ncbi:MAG: glycoside hydrolase family 13 protein [Clostridia bacterium]|nr:glycoside hydrolase family 13 protein [Clostridia bacterium]
MSIYHHSKSQVYRQPFGAVPVGTKVWLKADLQNVDPASCQLVVRYEAGTTQETRTYAAPGGVVELDDLSVPGVYFYHFTVCGEEEPAEHQLTVYEADLKVPDWFKNTIIYQIFPDRFYQGDGPVETKKNSFFYGSKEDIPMYIKDQEGDILRWDFFGGNLWGVGEKMAYIQSFGANTIYLNPIFQAVSNHRYDTGDYKHVDGLLGGDRAFDVMMNVCRENGVKIILDGVFSHTGEESIYFDRSGLHKKDLPEEEQGAWQSPHSKYRKWYDFKEDGTYACWWGVKALPNVNEMEPSYLDYTVTGEDSVIRHWMAKGVSGWRLDVADELPDGFIGKLRQAVDESNPEGVVFGEVWEDASNKVSYGCRRLYYAKKELHSNTNYVFRNALLDFFKGEIDAYACMNIFLDLYENYPKENFYAQVNMTGSHDVKRLFTCMKETTKGNEALAKDLVRVYSLIQFTFPGVPLIYYGDETCMEGGEDPDNRRYYPWDRQDEGMVAWFRNLGRLRGSHAVFRQGDWMPIYVNADVFAFKRMEAGQEYVVAADRFGRGCEYLCKELEKVLEKSYTVVNCAGGYGVLMQLC